MIGIGGFNWLTAVGEPFRSWAGGAPALAAPGAASVKVKMAHSAPCSWLGADPSAARRWGLCIAATLLVDESRLSAVWSPSPDDPRAPVFGRAAKRQSLAWERPSYR